jgi:hypothetical protein
MDSDRGNLSESNVESQSDDPSPMRYDTSDALPLPREHSYLTASHPLIGNDQSLQKSASRNPNDLFFDLAVLKLFGVVLFPGSTIPVKLRDRSLVEYLGRQIAICRELPHLQSEVRLGILTFNTESRNSRNHEKSLIGRIGTIATIKYTHERTDDDNISAESLNSSDIWRRYQDGTELVFTAVGTQRFRIVESNSSTDGLDSKIFKVEQLNDTSLCLPSMQHYFSSPPKQYQKELTGKSNIHRRHLYNSWCLSIVTPVPFFVCHRYSPWKLVSEMSEALEENDGRNHLPSLGAISKETLSDATKFSFWCASNMPFSEADRLSLLEINSTYERLQKISKKVKELSQRTKLICCSGCNTNLSTVENVFTVGGAEGATSAYVNDHGCIHQITTVRQVDTRGIFFQGPASTENTYFPGYSWTICYCGSCASHLGWLFRRVDRASQITEIRPKLFYGFMSSNVMLRDLSGVITEDDNSDSSYIETQNS